MQKTFYLIESTDAPSQAQTDLVAMVDADLIINAEFVDGLASDPSRYETMCGASSVKRGTHHLCAL